MFSGLQFRINLQPVVDEQWIQFIVLFSMCMLSPGFELLLPIRRRRMPICLGNTQAQSLDPEARPSVAMVELGEGDDLMKLASQQACIKEP